MDTSLLQKAGLTESQAKGYLALIEHGTLSPAELAEKTGETRTNAYAIADKLVALGVATKKDGSKATYKANHPSTVEALAERRRRVVMRNEQEVKQGISPLIDMFYRLREEPSARTLQGMDGIKEVFKDILRTGEDIYYLRAPAEFPTVPIEFFNEYKRQRLERGIHTYALSPMSDGARSGVVDGLDSATNIHRTFFPSEAYTQPVEIEAYGDKVAFIAYGETQMATIISSPPIAAALKEVFRMLIASYEQYSDSVKQDLAKK